MKFWTQIDHSSTVPGSEDWIFSPPEQFEKTNYDIHVSDVKILELHEPYAGDDGLSKKKGGSGRDLIKDKEIKKKNYSEEDSEYLY